MDHSHMHHEDVGELAAGRCNMNMLFTWDTTNLCIIFRKWHIRSTTGLIVSLALVVFITAGYEALREFCRRYELWSRKKLDTVPRRNQAEGSTRSHIIKAHTTKAVLYAIQNFYAFMLMLLFMTYNGFVMLAMTVGWFLGYMVFGGATPLVKETACH